MKHSNTGSVKLSVSLSLLVMVLFSGGVLAQATKADLGKQEYLENCAVCHGNDGKGKGPYLQFLQRSPTDLTTLTKRSGGVFPVSRMYETIEGLNVPSHGAGPTASGPRNTMWTWITTRRSLSARASWH